MRRSFLSAFTLVEVLVIVGVVGVLAALLLPAIKSAVESGNQAKCTSNLRQLSSAAVTYTADHDGWLPPMRYPYNYTWWPDAISPYLTEKPWESTLATTSGVFRCPSGSKDWPYKGTSIEIAGVNYAYNAKVGYIVNGDPTGLTTIPAPLSPSYRLRKMATCKYPSQTALIMDGDSQRIQFEFYRKSDVQPTNLRHHKRANVLFVDGHVDLVDFDKIDDDTLMKMSLAGDYNDQWP